jgi:hypothetical protein
VKKARETPVAEESAAMPQHAPLQRKRFPNLSRTRRQIKGRDVALSQGVIDDRADRA